ncbi:hypothetical protein QTJ04_07805 [Clostridium perfringens]|nr:hypothetical protein [Clostridium perfringens]DAO46963.1 MAG TPA: hypothetical protein [Bacteriophage sp.]
MGKKENFLTDFFKSYGLGVCVILVVFSIIIPAVIWIALLLNFEKGAEASWSIGVGLFGSLIGGLCTLIAFLLSSYQTKKIQKQNMNFNMTQLELNNAYLKITEIKELIEKLYEFNEKIIETQYLNLNDENEIKKHCNRLLKFTHCIKCYSLAIVNNDLRNRFEEFISNFVNSKVVDLKYYQGKNEGITRESLAGNLASTMDRIQGFQVEIEKDLEEQSNKVKNLLLVKS